MKFKSIMIIALALLLGACKGNSSDENQEQSQTVEEPKGKDNLAYKWAKIALDATANDTEWFKPRPTISSRFLSLIFVSIFDAWSVYDDKAIPVYLNADRRPEEERTLENKEKAISYAAYRAMMHYYYSDSTMFTDFMNELGFDPKDESIDPSTPQGIGNLAAQTVIDIRREDGSNQYATVEGSNGISYFDYTMYKPVNPVDKNNDINRWQPKYFLDNNGNKYAPGCLTPHWQLVKPIGLDSASQFRPGPPPQVGSEQLEKEVAEVVELQANLTPEEMALVEFMRDGPKSVQQAGHWLIFAQYISERDQHTLDEDVKMYFLNQIVAMDAFIASWDSKMHYDFARPYALVHHYYKGQKIKGWAGPEEGWIEMNGEDWRPYSPATFLCPPFPSYTSGHSTVSGACSKALELYTGSNEFGQSVKLVPGALTHPNDLRDTVTLHFETLSGTAEMAGQSRVLGGYHIQADNVAGLQLGRDVATHIYNNFYLKHIGEK
ncbi:vanadium-dependent haloperoxidase [Paracrocinitomix mangrovi]|uniref:vanadium-dependent haloperoxidase n=1 Tax=Paracrocinitomix mangrovi TaxID=2862509 RepID=UPI001C8DC2F1|nr:vanadium-dependent haloperoxidase [Paracrocinitomix mangrovi]UKN02903.1 vanadium-dependent haloperoxidase [Paracrocinitomix mangrovi]